jgi:DNA-binding NarL/FixJ family response regulator
LAEEQTVSIRVVVGEDDFLVRQGVERALATQDDVVVVASCDRYESLVDAVVRHEPDVVVTDIRMPPTMSDEGIRLASMLATDYPSVGVVVLSQYDEPEYVLALLDAGFDRRSYLLKERISDVTQLAEAVRAVADGGSVIDPRVVERLVRSKTARRSPLEWLTPRERDVLEAMAQGMSNTAIATHLGIGLRSVEKHISMIFEKLGLSEEDHVHRRVRAVLTYLAEVG